MWKICVKCLPYGLLLFESITQGLERRSFEAPRAKELVYLPERANEHEVLLKFSRDEKRFLNHSISSLLDPLV